jgi:cobalt-zinc-cadmium efflux system outer membrane protein
MKINRFTAVVWLAVTLAGPAVYSQPPPTQISRGLEERTGHGLNPSPKAGSFVIPDGVSLSDGLSEDEAVAIALWNNAAFQAELAALGLARADLIEAGLLRNPSLTLIFPISPKLIEAVANWPFEALWQRPRRVAAARLELDRVTESLMQSGLNLVRDVRVAYADLALAGERSRIATEAVRERGQIAEIVSARLRAGDISELETSAARLDARLAEEQATRLAHEVALAADRLRALLGLAKDGPSFNLSPSSMDQTGASPSPAVKVSARAAPALEMPGSGVVGELIKQALAGRPELKAAELAIEAAGQRAKWERSKILNLSGIVKEYGRSSNGFEQGPGLQVELPIFHRNQGGLTRAEAEIERAARQYIAISHRVALEVREAYTQLAQARASLDLWRARVLPPIEEDIRRAERAYAAGDVSYLFVLETTRRLTDARLREAELKAALERATAQLEHSIGRRLIANL